VTTLVLLPGMDGTGALFQPFIAALSPKIRIVVVSYPPDQALGYKELQALVMASLPSEPFVLLGESFSGPIAISVAAQNPPGLVGIILCCSFSENPRPNLALPSIVFRLPLPLPPIHVLAAALMGRFSSKPMRSALRQALSKVSPHVLRSRALSVLQVNATANLSKIEVPLCYLQATEDWLVPEHVGKQLTNALPNATIERISGPHLLLQICPIECAEKVERFLDNVSSTKR
jgi:pimeloyl-[acyl-carrier protein] methyl ester esterase